MRAPKLVPLVLVVLVVFLSGGCPRQRAPRNMITVGLQQEVDTLWPAFREMLASDEVLVTGKLTLSIFNDAWELVPLAAQSIPTLQNGGVELLPDGRMRTTWRLHPDLRWADGVPLTADDFVFGLGIYQDPSQEILDRTYAEKVERMEAAGADRRTLIITWKEPYAYHANYRNFEALPRHIVEPLYRQAGSGLKQHPWGRKPLLSGAFTTEHWEDGQFISMVRNPYAPPRLTPRVDKIIFKFIPMASALEANLVSGAVDAISPIGLQVDQALELQRRRGDTFDFHYTEGLAWEHIDFNLDDPWLKDVRMRRALTHAVNRKNLVESLFHGRQQLSDNFVPPRRVDVAEDIRRYGHDPVEAVRLLEEMGWMMGEDGIRQRGGEKLRLTIVTTSGVSTRERVEQIIQSDFRKVGVDLSVENVPAKVLFGEVTRRRKFKHLILFAWTMDPLKVSDTLWRCDYIPRAQNSWQGQNYGGWCNERATALLKDAAATLDDGKRNAMSREMQRVWAEDLPALPLYFRSDVSITRKGFRNWKPTGTLAPVTWNAHEWFIE